MRRETSACPLESFCTVHGLGSRLSTWLTRAQQGHGTWCLRCILGGWSPSSPGRQAAPKNGQFFANSSDVHCERWNLNLHFLLGNCSTLQTDQQRRLKRALRDVDDVGSQEQGLLLIFQQLLLMCRSPFQHLRPR